MRILITLIMSLLAGDAFAACNATVPYVFTNGAVADATQVNANYSTITTAMSANCAGSGVNTDITALNALATPITPAAGGTTTYYGGTSAGTANAQTIASTVPSNFSLVVGRTIEFIPGATNTAAMTLAVNGLTATAVYKPTASGPVALKGGEVGVGALVRMTYDGTHFVLTQGTAMFGLQTFLSAASTTDIGSAGSHSIVIIGPTTVDSFGASATIAEPEYHVCFGNNITIANHVGVLDLPGGANIAAAGGDCLVALYQGGISWRVIIYQRVSGLPLVAPAVVGLGYGQSWQNPSRSINTTYTNSTPLPIQVSAWVNNNNSTTTMAVAGVQVAQASSGGGVPTSATLTAIVPVGATYSIIGGGSIAGWAELR